MIYHVKIIALQIISGNNKKKLNHDGVLIIQKQWYSSTTCYRYIGT